MQQYKTQYGTIFAVREYKGHPAIMLRAEHKPDDWSLSSMIEPFTPGAWTAEELQGQLDNWAATKGWQPVAEPASAEPPEIVDEGSEPYDGCPYLQPLENSRKYNCRCSICEEKFANQEICNKGFRLCGWYLNQKDKEAQMEDDADADGFPGWVRPMVEAFLQFPFFRELPAFTAFAIRHSEPVQHHQGGTLADGLYDTDSKGVKFFVFRGDSSDQYREVSYTWADFVRRCKAEGLEPDLREKEKTPHPQPGDVYQDPQSGQLYKIGELTNGKKTCYLTMRSNAQGGTWVPVNSSVYPNLSDAQGEFEAWIRTKKLEPVAPTGAAAATTDVSAAVSTAETTTTSESGAGASNSPGSPSAPADMSPRDTKTESNAPATPTTAMAASGNGLLPAFDFGADADTNAGLINDAQIFMAGSMARVMAAKRAHDRTANRYRGSWGKWCDFVGISRDTGDNMVRVAEQFGNIQVDGKPLIDLQPLKLLYATSKPSTPPEIRQQVENLDITSYKQYQDLLAKYDEEKAARAKTEKDAKAMKEGYTVARKNEEFTLKNLKSATAARDDATKQRDEAFKQRDAALQRANAAENRAAGAQKLADQRGTENTDLRRKLKEAESRPIDIAVAEPSEADKERWRKEGEDRMAATLQDTVLKAHKAKITAENQVADLQEQLAAARPDADACQRTADTLYETTENLRLLLRTQLKLAQLPPDTYGKVVAHVLQAADALRDTVRSCAPADYTMDDEEEDFL